MCGEVIFNSIPNKKCQVIYSFSRLYPRRFPWFLSEICADVIRIVEEIMGSYFSVNQWKCVGLLHSNTAQILADKILEWSWKSICDGTAESLSRDSVQKFVPCPTCSIKCWIPKVKSQTVWKKGLQWSFAQVFEFTFANNNVKVHPAERKIPIHPWYYPWIEGK